MEKEIIVTIFECEFYRKENIFEEKHKNIAFCHFGSLTIMISRLWARM